MDFRLAIVLDATGRVTQTAVLAETSEGRAFGHQLLRLIEPEVAVFTERVRLLLAHQQQLS